MEVFEYIFDECEENLQRSQASSLKRLTAKEVLCERLQQQASTTMFAQVGSLTTTFELTRFSGRVLQGAGET